MGPEAIVSRAAAVAISGEPEDHVHTPRLQDVEQ